jgi:hypothetical protein
VSRVLAALLLGLAFAGQAAAQIRSDWEEKNEARLWTEENVSLPAYPARERLIAFDAGGGLDFSFFIDPATVSVGKDGVVRYGLVARSAGGAENVRFEGLRCATAEYRIYAVGRPDGSWSARANEWRPFERGAARSVHGALSRHYFCPNRQVVSSTEEAVGALKQGGHPAARLEFR